jgi:glucuronate isomerase
VHEPTPSGFLNDSYLLGSATARQLYRTVRDLPILDAHNHADLVEIVENRPWTDIWQVEGATDHYVWEMMRKRGVPEEKITGDASNHDKWLALAGVFPQLAGNPTYEWIHLDLKRRFGIDAVIRPDTAEAIWQQTLARLAEPDMRPQRVLEAMGVEVMCTTDDPTVHLPHHERAREEITHTRILPTWRPDKAINIERETWRPLVERLGRETEFDTSTLDGFAQALTATHEYFRLTGCVASDHGLTVPWGHQVDRARAAAVHASAFAGHRLDQDDVADYHAYMLHFFGDLNADASWVMQLHIGAVRDYRDWLFDTLGPDTGGDVSDQQIPIVEPLREFLNAFDGRLQIVLYCLDPGHQPSLTSVARAFPGVSLGVPWWFNDSPYGIETQLRYAGTVDLLANSAGMVTDSRKLISFGSRTEIFRRVLCGVVGEAVEPVDLVTAIAYDRPKALFFGG